MEAIVVLACRILQEELQCAFILKSFISIIKKLVWLKNNHIITRVVLCVSYFDIHGSILNNKNG